MSTSSSEKLGRLKQLLSSFEGCAVAFSGGVDSTLLLETAREVLEERCVAVIADSNIFPAREHASALEWVRERAIPHAVFAFQALDIPGFSVNPAERCYFCKKELFLKIQGIAADHGLPVVADGANRDDEGDFRPGMRAARELGVRSPLRECGLTKDDIRTISREVYGLPGTDRQPMACMASRIPYGSVITKDKLRQVETVECFLEDTGFKAFRARHHGDLLRIEVGKEELGSILQEQVKRKIVEVARRAGFVYVTLDLQGFRPGSMNESIGQDVASRTMDKEPA